MAVNGKPSSNNFANGIKLQIAWFFQSTRFDTISFSFVRSCERHKIDPFAWFRDVLAKTPATPITQLTQFLPDQWKIQQNRGQEQKKATENRDKQTTPNQIKQMTPNQLEQVASAQVKHTRSGQKLWAE